MSDPVPAPVLVTVPVQVPFPVPVQVPSIPIKSSIWFPAGSLIQTDQEEVDLINLDPSYHTINSSRIVSMTNIYGSDGIVNTLVFLEKDSYF